MPSLQLSLCVILPSRPVDLNVFFQDLTAFFQKFPLSYEVLLALDPSQDQSRTLAEAQAARGLPIRIQSVSQGLANAARVEKLLTSASADFLVTYPLDQGLPLGEVFKILQHFFTEPDLEALFTHRSTQKSFQTTRPQPRSRWEQSFTDILREKNKWPFTDPFSPLFGLRRSAFLKIQKNLKLDGLDATPEIQRAVLQTDLRHLEISVVPTMTPSPAFGFKRWWHSLRFVLFRV